MTVKPVFRFFNSSSVKGSVFARTSMILLCPNGSSISKRVSISPFKTDCPPLVSRPHARELNKHHSKMSSSHLRASHKFLLTSQSPLDLF